MRSLLFSAVLLTAVFPAAAAVHPDLLESSRQLEAFPATQGQGSESARLKRFFDLYWRTTLIEAPEYATYVGAPGFDDRLSDLSPETTELAKRISHQERKALTSIDRSRLTPSEQVDYDLALGRIDEAVEAEKFNQGYPVHQLNGPQNEIGLLLTSMPARSVHDYENMLTRLRAYPRKIDQTIAGLEKGLKEGITPPRVILRDVPAQIDGLLTQDPLKSAALTPFQEIPESIPAVERERLRGEAARLFREGLEPAFRRLRAYLVDTYIPAARETLAVGDLPGGKEWYAYLLRTATTTDLTPEQIHQIGLSEVKRIRGEMDALIASTGFKGSFADFATFLRTDPRFYYDKPEDLVTGYRDIAKRIDPELIKLFGRLPRLPYGVTVVPEFQGKSQTTGYYGNGSLAAGRAGWFYANTYNLKARPKWLMEALTAHEAVPGHHIQYSLVEELGELPDWRKWDVYPAFSEGWAFYAETLGYEIGLYKDPYSRFGQLSNEIWRACRLVVDTGLHTMGWTRQQAIDYMRDNSAKPVHDAEVEVDRYIVSPGGATCYKIGQMKIRELRTYAERELGPRFDVRAFHDEILGHGQLPLRLLEKNMKAWVEEQKGKRP
jgi:uncharacterized protein (DUF885 family)